MIVAGVLLIIYGIFTAFNFPFQSSRVHDIVSRGFFYTLIGGVVFIEGVVIQGFKRWYALILHLAAAYPYYLAIQQIVNVGNSNATQIQQYFTAAQYYFFAGIILNILGIAANNLRRETREAVTPIARQ